MGHRAHFEVLGLPRGAPRPRFGKGGRVHKERRAGRMDLAWRQLVKLMARPHRPRQPIDTPTVVSWDAFLPRPARCKRRRLADGPDWADVKPDRDNLDKAILDCLTEDGWFSDDCRVVCGQVRKLYHGLRGRVGLRVYIETLDRPPDVVDLEAT